MASSDMASIDPWSWTFRPPSFMDPWFSEAISRETQTLTKALQQSLSSSDCLSADSFAAETLSPFLSGFAGQEEAPAAVTTPTPTVSNVSGGSDPDSAPMRHRSAIPVSSGGKVSKRKPRKSKRSQTTFINADPANFRQMVQQVTGARFPGAQLQIPQILKPEPQRAVGCRYVGAAGGNLCLPTLDTSAFLLDHNQQQEITEAGPTSSAAAASVSYVTSTVSAADGGGGGGVGGLVFDSFASFPTLESWNAM